MFQDITDRKLFSSRLEQLAHYDPLTHLPNRRLLSDRVDHAVQRASRSDDQHALLFIDLDHFKRINDTIGHLSGDRLLTVIAERLLKCVRTSDTVARLGGDEFAVLLEDITPMDVERIADKILASLAAPVELEGRDWYIGASIGISLTPRDGADMAALLKNADTAMYRAKADGRHCFRFFDEGMAEQATLQVARETALHLAVERKAFALHYQPQLDMATGEVVGVEALIRWRQGDKMISPMEFIPLAEETGHIIPIGHWVLTTACRDIKSLHAEGFNDLKLAVNISAVELKQNDFIEQILMVLAESGFPPDRLELEITESTMMVDVTRVASVLDALSATGISLSIDDFGTGYSSLSYLKQLPVDLIKVDRSFVRDVPRDKDDCTIVRAIVTMTHALGLHVVAEGVETEEQLQFLRNEGCDISQGYLISRPVPLDELRQWLHDRSHSNA
jgi:diguanylate cyclase (GGDEF)-like protein